MAQIGTDKIKEGLHLAFAFWKEAKVAYADGKLTLQDALGFLDEVLQISGVVASSKELLAQALDLDSTERTEINEWAKGEFPNETPENVAKKVSAGLDWIISSLMAYSVFRPIPTTPAPIPPTA